MTNSVATVIWGQLPIMTKMACGAREPIAISDHALSFKVGAKGERIVVRLDPSDTYTVQRLGRAAKVKEETSDVYAEDLSDIVYHMVNK
jgi:hypothetical protein